MRITEKDDGKKVIAINVRVDLDAYQLMQQFSPTPRGHGRFLSRLIYEFQARYEERDRIRKQMAEVVGSDHAA
jgi:hypothetical protein